MNLYPPLRNAMEVVHLVKGGKFLEYRAKVNECIGKAKEQSPLNYISFTNNIDVWT